MSKYSVAKEVLAHSEVQANSAELDPTDVLEALLVTAIQNLISARGGSYTRDFLQYELDNVGSDGVFEIQKR